MFLYTRQILVLVPAVLQSVLTVFCFKFFFISSALFQIMEINGQNFENISVTKAVDILRNNTHLSLTVKTNIFGELSQSICRRIQSTSVISVLI